MNKIKQKDRKDSRLVELIIVIAIVGILAAVLISNNQRLHRKGT